MDQNKQTKLPSAKIATHYFIIMAIAAITLWVLRSCLNNQFTNWDDPDYIISNSLVKDISLNNLKAIFSRPVMGIYHPITMLSYAIEYYFVRLSPWLYHFDNLVMHIVTTILVYAFVYLLTSRKITAIITALLFGIHPMHVESVAWISGRKDLLCGLFYVAACIIYLLYLQSKTSRKKGLYAGVLILFICALLSKPVAVTLPLVLLLVDYYKSRAWGKNILLEKIPHFLLAVLSGTLSVITQRAIGSISLHNVSYSVFERLALGAYALIWYMYKAVAPSGLCCFYPYPQNPGSLPFVFYTYPVVLVAIVFIIWKFARRNKDVIFGLLFFLVNIALLLQVIPVGQAIVADRYSYISYIGLFFIAGRYFQHFYDAGIYKLYRKLVLAIAIICFGYLGYAANERCKVWYDSISLWQDELKQAAGQNSMAYDNLGAIYYDKWMNTNNREEKKTDADSAEYLMKQSIGLDPDDSDKPYEAVASLLYAKREFDSAQYFFSMATKLNPTAGRHLNYGNFLMQMGKSDSALAEYNAAIVQNPDLYAPYLNSGKILLHQKHWDEAMKDFNEAINTHPNSGEAYYQRSFCDTEIGIRAQALKDVETAISLGYQSIDTDYYHDLRK